MDDDDDGAEIVVCQGPPRCVLVGDDAVDAQRAGCVWCSRIVIMTDGREFVSGPHEA